MFDDTATRVRPGSKTLRAGGVVDDWSDGAVSRLTLTGIVVQPLTSDEQNTVDRDIATTEARIFSRPGVDLDVQARDRVEWQGLTYQVIGDPGRWLDRFNGGVHHVEVLLRRYTG